MRRRNSHPALAAPIGLSIGIFLGGISTAAMAGPENGAPIRLTALQMDGITAGTALVSSDASAYVAGDQALALTAAHTLNRRGASAQQVSGGSGAVAAGSQFAATNSTTSAFVGNGASNASVVLDANSAASGSSVTANALTQVLAFDGAVADVALGLARSFSQGGQGNTASATSEVGGNGDFIAGTVTRLVQTPQFTLAQATAFAASFNPTSNQPVANRNSNARSAANRLVRCRPRSSVANP